MAAEYVLRFFFDAGAGICLWAGNDAAREAFGYPVELDDLPLREETKAALGTLMTRYDAGFDWNDPAGAGLWSPAEETAFFAEARDVLARVRHELGLRFEVRDELD